MKKIACIAIEDEPHALKLLKEYVEQIPFLEWIGGFRQPLEALPLLNQNKVQLLFLDINVPKMDGMSFYKSLNHKPHVIFTTAYAEYAVEGYSVEAVDYLLKPILFERFLQACNKVQNLVATTKVDQPTSTATIYVKSGTKWHQLDWNEILFLEKDDNYVIFHSGHGQKILTRQNLSDVEKSIPHFYCRIHKSFIVNTRKIDVVEREQVIIFGRKIPLADSYRKTFMGLLGLK